MPSAGWAHAPGGWHLPLVALVVAGWLAAATLAVIRGARARIEARTAREWALRLRGLLLTLPASYVIIGADGSATASEQTRKLLGLATVDRLDDLAGSGPGLVDADLATLKTHVEALRIAGEEFSISVRSVDGRWLQAQGYPAAAEVAGPQGAVIWLRETTEERVSADTLRAENKVLARDLELNAALFATAPLPMWQRDADLTLVAVNSAYAQSVQAPTTQAVIEQGIELAAAGNAAARRVIESGQLQVREEAVIIGDARRVLRIVETPLAGGGIGGFAIDVTEREEARLERDRLERAQTDTLDRLSAGVALFSADRGLTFFNKAFAALFHLDPAWLDERPEFDRVLDRMRDAGRLPEQRDFPSWRATRRGWFSDARAAVEETWPLPDTSVIHVIAQPHPDGGLLMVFEDRSEQLRLASSRDTLVRVQQATLDNLYEGVAVFGADGRIRFSNARFAEMWGFDPVELATRPHIDEILARTAHLVVDPDRAAGIREIIRATTEADRRESRSDRVMLTDGRQLDFAAVPLPDGNALFTYLDVTDSARIQSALRDRNEALEAADRLKSAFVANVSYELRTPLTAISGFGEMLAAGYAGALNERQAEYTGSILTSSQRLQLLIDDILDLAGTEAGELELDLSNVDVVAVAEAAAANVRADAEAKGLVLLTDLDDVGAVQADERRLRQILNNLLLNAVRFTPAGGHIEVVTVGAPSEISLVVRDNGVGIADAEQAAVFERFRKGSNAGSQGVGLGLSLVREFVELHHGTVSLASRVGEGTEVTIRLPRRHDTRLSA